MKKINLSFFILLLFFIQVILTDSIIYFLEIRYAISNAISIILLTALVIFLIKMKKIKIEYNFSKWDLIFFAVILVITGITIIFPDELWDSYSYHLYLQQEPFADKINDDYFPGRTLTSFVFPIADRVFTLFRLALGFRLGALPGYLIIIVMYYEIKKILKLLIKKETKEMYISILSMFPLGTFVILQQMGTYYIDNFSLVVLLEFVYIILTEAKEIFKNKTNLYYLALIVGISVCIKITNVIYMFLPLLYVLIINIKDIKNIKWYDYILLVITAFMPMLPYLLDAIIQTGSPVFPYYNTIFKSEYFPEINWLDERYGPKNLLEYLIWPIYIIFYPERAYEGGKTDFAFAYGYIIVIAYLIRLIYIKFVKKEKIELNTETIYIITLFYFFLVWGKFIIGYTRYAGIIVILSTIYFIKLLLYCMENKKVITIIIMVGILLSTAQSGFNEYITYGSLYNYVLLEEGNQEIQNVINRNIQNLFKDKETTKVDIDGIWGSIYDDSAVPMLLNVNDRIVCLELGKKTGLSEKSQEIYWKNVLENNIYVPLYDFKLEGKLQYLDKFKFEIQEISHILPELSILKNQSPIYIVKVKYNENITTGSNKVILENLLNGMEGN